MDNNIGWNNNAQNDTTQSNSWNINANNNTTQRNMWALNPISSALGQHRTTLTSNNNNGENVGWDQNQKPKTKKIPYRGREQ